MSRRTACVSASALLIAPALAPGPFLHAVAERAGQENPGVLTLKARSELVLLDVSVRDSKGALVAGLTRENFQVFEEGRKEQITQFSNVDTPVSIGLVVDASGSMRSKRAEVVEAGLAFAKESNASDEFFVINFNDRVVRGLPPDVPFTDNLDRLRRALYYGPAQGRTALYDAIAEGLKHIGLGTREKRTLIVVSDGGDNASHISLDDLLRHIEGSLVTIYAVAIVDPDDIERNVGVLRKIVQISGGQLFIVPEREQVAPVFHEISQSVRSRYTIGYTPDSTLDRESVTLRHIRVVAMNNGRKLAVRARTSYRLDTTSAVSAKGAGTSFLREKR